MYVAYKLYQCSKSARGRNDDGLAQNGLFNNQKLFTGKKIRYARLIGRLI